GAGAGLRLAVFRGRPIQGGSIWHAQPARPDIAGWANRCHLVYNCPRSSLSLTARKKSRPGRVSISSLIARVSAPARLFVRWGLMVRASAVGLGASRTMTVQLENDECRRAPRDTRA